MVTSSSGKDESEGQPIKIPGASIKAGGRLLQRRPPRNRSEHWAVACEVEGMASDYLESTTGPEGG